MKQNIFSFFLGAILSIIIFYFKNKVDINKKQIELNEQIEINDIIIDTLINKIKIQNDILKSLKTQKDLIKLKKYDFKDISRDSLIFIITNTEL